MSVANLPVYDSSPIPPTIFNINFFYLIAGKEWYFSSVPASLQLSAWSLHTCLQFNTYNIMTVLKKKQTKWAYHFTNKMPVTVENECL